MNNRIFIRVQGFSLLEVLIAWAILSVVLLGIATMQVNGLRDLRRAYWLSLASNQLDNMVAVLRLSRDIVWRAHRYQQWQEQNKQLLPQAKGKYYCDSVARFCGVEINWLNSVANTLRVDVRL